MAVDHSSIPKDLHPSATPGRIHPPPSWAPIAPSPGGPLFSSPAAAVADDLLSPRKVKLLCSFGGRIFPRPSDGILRYVGGHTRIISLRKDVSFLEFVGKMAEAVGASAVAVKYQLPGEDLDALISVSCPDDLVNMMEEYDKLAAASPDGSLKLRAFLFPPSELASADPSLHLGAIDDVGQRYVEAVNGFAVSDSVRGPLRKDSFASAASSTQDSEGTTGGDAMEDGAGEGMSPPPLPSPAVNLPQDAPRMVYVGGNNPIMIADALVGIPGGSILAPGMGIPAQNLTLARPEQPPMAPYMPPAYVEPHQLQYITPQHLGMVGGLQPINVAPLTMHSYVPSGVPIPSNMSSTVSHVDSIQAIQPRLAPNLENPYGGKVTQLPADPNLRAFQSLSQLPPLPPTYLQPPLPQLQPLRLEDCLMCQKSLPHAHSDTLVQEHGIGTPDSFHEVSTIFYSQRSEDVTRHRAVPVATGALVDNLVELNAENMTGVSQSAGFLHPHIPEAQHASKRPNVKAGNRPVGIESPGEVSPSNGMLLGNHMREQLVNPLQQQQQIQQQQFWPTLQPPPDLIQQETVTGLPDEDLLLCQQLQTGQPPNFMVRQEVITNPSDSGTFKNANFHAAEPAIQDYVHQITDGNLEPIEGRMEALRLSPLGPSETIHQGKPAIDPLDAPSDVPYLVVENGHKVIPQFGDSAFFIGNAGVNYRYIPAGNYAQPIEQLPLATSEFTWLQGVPNVETNQGVNVRENHDPFPYNLGIGIGHSVPYENFIGMPMGFKDIGPVGNDNSTTISVAGLKVDCSQLHSTKKINNLAASPGVISSPFTFSNLSNLSEHAEGFHELMSAGISFCDQDPWEVPGQTNLLPPKPSRLVSKEAVVLTDPCVANHLTNGSDIVAMLEEGNLHHPPDSMIKELCLEPVKLTKASEEEHIKQQLQAVAEDVAASVLLPSVPPASVALEIKNLAPEFNNELGSIEDNKELEEAVLDEEIEVSIVKQVEKENPGVQLTEDIGRLQIIKNSDLEELQELGSGTFGTVCHGKWRGSDVAIKRINDRCFAGKKSEEERMRADFWNEASKLADLHHPNVVAFYGVVLDGLGGSVATVTEYMVNGSLRHALLRNDKAFDQRKCLILAMDVAFGMEYLHAKNIIHFDLKSDNLLVNLRDPQRPICKVGDLGLSKVKCKTLISGGMRGTLPWMAPELLYGNDSLVSEKVDVFSFGVVMWEILTGEEPYADLHYGAIIGGILSNSLRPPVPESCNPEWRSLMEQCWSAEPLDRPSFTEVANRLRCMAAARPQRTATSGT